MQLVVAAVEDGVECLELEILQHYYISRDGSRTQSTQGIPLKRKYEVVEGDVHCNDDLHLVIDRKEVSRVRMMQPLGMSFWDFTHKVDWVTKAIRGGMPQKLIPPFSIYQPP